MSITATAVSTVGLTYTTGTSWSIFNATTRATAGNLQANWTDIASQLDTCYKPLLNSARDEINIFGGASGAEYMGVSSLTGIATGTTVYQALSSLNTILNGASGADYIGISGITGICTGSTVYSAVNSMNTTASVINSTLLSATADISALTTALANTDAVLASATADITIFKSASGAEYVGISGITHNTFGSNLGTSVYSAIYNINSITPKMTTAAINYFVNVTSGSDSNNGLSAGAAFQSLQTAINKLPQVINDTVTIQCATGTYSENLSIQGFMGKGLLLVYGGSSYANATANFTITKIAAYHVKCLTTIRGWVASIATGRGFDLQANDTIALQYCDCVASAVATSDPAVYALYNAYVNVVSCNFSNRFAGVFSLGSRVFSNTNAGSNNTYGLLCQNVGTIGKNGTQPTGTTNESATLGGEIR